MKTPLKPRHFVGALFILAGVIWTIMFPKTSDLLRPDFVASVAIGIGLMVPGVLLLFSMEGRRMMIALSIVLLWSLLLNGALLAEMKAIAVAVRTLAKAGEPSRIR